MSTGTGTGTGTNPWVWVRVRAHGYGYGYGYETMGMGTGTGPTRQRVMGTGTGTGSSPWVRVRVLNFAPGYGYGYGYGHYCTSLHKSSRKVIFLTCLKGGPMELPLGTIQRVRNTSVTLVLICIFICRPFWIFCVDFQKGKAWYTTVYARDVIFF